MGPWCGSARFAAIRAIATSAIRVRLLVFPRTCVGITHAGRAEVVADPTVLYGEPRTVDDKTIQMRMVYSNITRDSLRWEWQRTEDAWRRRR